jgi:hypothetical protein
MADEGPPDRVGVDEEGFQYDLYDHAAEGTEPEPPEDERPLDSLRVRQLAAARRGAYRARSYCVIALGACAVAAAQLVFMTVRHVSYAGWQLRPVGYVCGILAAAMAAAFFYRRAAEFTRELSRRPEALAEPLTPPDFSTLSDGSHHWKNLEEMNEGT